MSNSTFGETIKQLRIKKDLSQKDLAAMLDICNTTLSQYEKNKRAPKFETLLKLADILGVSTDYLLSANADQDQYGSFQTTELRQLEKLKATHRALYNEMLSLADVSPENQEAIYRMLYAYLSMFNSKQFEKGAPSDDVAFYKNFTRVQPQAPLFVNEDSDKKYNK